MRNTLRDTLRIEGIPVFQLTMHQEVKYQNCTLSIRSNSLILKNAGRTDVRLNNLWTMTPGDTLSLGATSNVVSILKEEIVVTFPDDISNSNGNNRLEIIELVVNHPELAHYVDQTNYR
ncbi:MAG: hypothetical protein AAGI23_09385 [Bacteroidota bacterium]